MMILLHISTTGHENIFNSFMIPLKHHVCCMYLTVDLAYPTRWTVSVSATRFYIRAYVEATFKSAVVI